MSWIASSYSSDEATPPDGAPKRRARPPGLAARNFVYQSDPRAALRSWRQPKAVLNKQPVGRPQQNSAGQRRPQAEVRTWDPLEQHGYRTEGPIATGAFSTIVHARRITAGAGPMEVAVKSFDNAKCLKNAALCRLRDSETDSLRSARDGACASGDAARPCRYVANLIETFEGAKHRHLVLEYCAGGSLNRHLQQLQKRGRDVGIAEDQAAVLAGQLGSALCYLHDLQIAHRDLKPDNLLFYAKCHLKLCDFGFATACGDKRLRTLCGTPRYMAPELLLESRKGYLGRPVDMWAFGAVIYEMLHGSPAFRGTTHFQVNARIRSAGHAPVAATISAPVRTLLKGLFVPNPSLRLSASAALEQHADWFGV